MNSQDSNEAPTDTLVLIPTPQELHGLCLSQEVEWPDQLRFELCGFGPIAAAARTMDLICRLRPRQIILAGIAGTYVDKMVIGSAYRFGHVYCHGIGVGEGTNFQSAGALGWAQWAGDAQVGPIRDRITFSSAKASLLTVCSASADSSEANRRHEIRPSASAEDMEAYGVALACQMANVPLEVVRGISNRVGDREHANWKTEDALQSAGDMILQMLQNESENHSPESSD